MDMYTVILHDPAAKLILCLSWYLHVHTIKYKLMLCLDAAVLRSPDL